MARSDNNTLSKVQYLIGELRNSRDIEKNVPKFLNLVEQNIDEIETTFSIRWLVSICDTYADFSGSERSRNALLISMFVNMLRVAETTYFCAEPLDTDKTNKAKARTLPLFEGICTFAIDRQDVFLNLSKRMFRTLERDNLIVRRQVI